MPDGQPPHQLGHSCCALVVQQKVEIQRLHKNIADLTSLLAEAQQALANQGHEDYL